MILCCAVSHAYGHSHHHSLRGPCLSHERADFTFTLTGKSPTNSTTSNSDVLECSSTHNFMITVASFFYPSPLSLASAITAVVLRRRRDADVSAVGWRAGYLSRGGNLRASNGPPFPPPPAFSVRLLVFRCIFSFCIYLLSPLCLASPRLSALSTCYSSNLLHTVPTSSAMTCYHSFLLNASEHYVRAWAPGVGGQALAEGEIPCLRCFMLWRVSDGLMCVSPLILLVLSGA